jgi:putative mRNA 3-end processing factor
MEHGIEPEAETAARADDLVVLRREGLYCPAGDFHIDPWRPVERAVITHAHADHARAGHRHYLATGLSAGVLKARLGTIDLLPLAYGQRIRVGDVTLSLHPAGHVLGSAQARIEHRDGRVWVASGDYFVSGSGDANMSCDAFDPQRCDVFITESTFGLPVYRWRPQREVLAEINRWWQGNAAAGKASLLLAYSFGKAQRLLAGIDASIGPIVVHDSVAAVNAAYRDAGVPLPRTVALRELDAASRRQALYLAPPGAQEGPWARSLPPSSDAFASGWMQLRGGRRRQGLDRGFALSDHADWPGLQAAIRATGAGRIIVTHGYEAVMVRWLREQGLQAGSFRTEFGGEEKS